mmetsp:Transcript_29994/g.95773  ORF Transcript_29994/g.95773 Transcript_29994/m.95773 type:complete len:176 (-) Transcript_29994:110-637(-)
MSQHGLCLIAGNYQPDGTGRDWFFVGDQGYRQGRRTPPPNARRHHSKPPAQRQGMPREMASTKAYLRASLAGSQERLQLPRPRGSSTQRDVPPRASCNVAAAERWLRRTSDLTGNDVLQAEKHHSGQPPPATVRWKAQLGSTVERWEDSAAFRRSPVSIIGKHRSFSMPVFPPDS